MFSRHVIKNLLPNISAQLITKLNMSSAAPSLNHLVFVYGTLKKDEPNHHLIQDSKNGKASFVSAAVTSKKWPLVIASRYNIPILLFDEGKGHNVQGEIYDVDDSMLQKLDELEDHPKFYERLLEDVKILRDGPEETMTVWIYFMKNFASDLLKRPFLENYSNKTAIGMEYVPKSKRTDSHFGDVKAL